MLAHIDEPDYPIASAFFHARGWVASESQIGPIEIDVNGWRYPVVQYARPDVQTAFPGHRTTGFSAFPRLWDFDWGHGIRLRVMHRDEVLYEHSISVAPEAAIDSAAQGAARLSKRNWLSGKVNCPECHRGLDATFSCGFCRKSHLMASGTLDLMTSNSADPSEFCFNGTLCHHGYDSDVTAIITEASSGGGYVLDCGAGLRPRVHPQVITLEITDYPTTDVIGINQDLPFADGIFEAVLSLHVLEHVSDPFRCASELIRVLKPGGRLFAATPMIVPEHGYPHHFYNPTREGLAYLFRGLRMERLFIPLMGHPINGVRSILEVYGECLPADEREKFVKMSVGDLLAGSLLEAIQQDHCTLLNEDGRWRLAANYCIVANKPV